MRARHVALHRESANDKATMHYLHSMCVAINVEDDLRQDPTVKRRSAVGNPPVTTVGWERDKTSED